MSEKLLFKSKKSSLDKEKEWKYHEYIKMRSEAEKSGLESFVYKNITYVQSLTPSGVVIYVREQKL